MMKDKIYFYMTNLYGWLIIILVGFFFVPIFLRDLTTGRMAISVTKIFLLLFSFMWLYFRIEFQLKRNVVWFDYLFIFIINAVYTIVFIYIYMNMYIYIDIGDYASPCLFLVFLDFFVYLMKHIYIKNIFLYIVSLLFLLIINCILLFYTTYFSFDFIMWDVLIKLIKY